MFYNHDILSRRKTGLGIVWLAATLGDRSIVRRLSRKEILNVDIGGACEYVRRPTEPLSLRLSSQLMFGLVKLYFHRTDLLYHDVTSAHSEVRRTMLSTTIVRTEESKQLDMRKMVASRDAITMPLDLAFFTLDFDAVATGMLYRWSVEPPQRGGLQEQSVEDGFRTPTPASFVEQEERITLPETRFDEQELGLPRAFGEVEDFGAMSAEGGFDEDEAERLDLGLEGAEFVQDRPDVLVPAAPEGIQRRSVGDDTITSQWQELEQRLTQEAARMEAGALIEGIPTVTPARRSRDQEDAAEVEASLRLAARQRRIAPFPSEDGTTMLSDTQLRLARSDYAQRMATERAAAQDRARRSAAHVTARHLLLSPPQDMALHPALAGMWQMTVGQHLVSRRAWFVQMRTEAALAPVDELPPTPPPPTPIALDLDEVADVGVARAAVAMPDLPAALRGARESLPWNVFMEHRRRSSMMPSISYDQPPTVERATTSLRLRDVSVETPTGLRRLPPHESPLFPPASPSTVAALDVFDLPPLSVARTPSVEPFRLGLPAAATTAAVGEAERSPTPPYQFLQQDMQEETRNFLEYARSIREQLQDPDFLFFSDLAPVASSTPAVAAQAFYHTLALAGRASFKVKQDEAYQEIRIFLVHP